MTADAGLEVIPTGGALGADVVGLDLGEDINEATFGELLRAWSEHLVLRFRQQELDEDSLIRFSASSILHRRGPPTFLITRPERKSICCRTLLSTENRSELSAIPNSSGTRT